MSSYTEEDYTCNLEFVDGKAKVTLVGKGKFEGMSVCTGTKEDAEVTEGACSGTGGSTGIFSQTAAKQPYGALLAGAPPALAPLRTPPRAGADARAGALCRTAFRGRRGF